MTNLSEVKWQGWAALAIFAVQNGAAVLIMRYSKIYGAQYSSQVAVFMQEAAIKLPVCMLLYAAECGGFLQSIRAIMTDLKERPTEWAQLAVPALLYTVQNTMLYVGYANVEAAIGQITYQTKILWTALFSVLILGKKLSANQWLALCVLAFGVVAVQITPQPAATHASSHTALADKHGGKRRGGGHVHDSHGRGLAETNLAAQNPMLGIGALVVAALCTAFASVYFEKMLKGASKPSLWLRNIQLAVYCSIIAAFGVLAKGDEMIDKHGWLYGFNTFTWLSVIWQAGGGILVAVTIKYADNILRGFSQGLALIFGAIGSYFLFNFQITTVFTLGCLLVIAAIFIYGSSAQTPYELCELMGGASFVPCLAPSKSATDADYKEVEACDSGESYSSSGLLDAKEDGKNPSPASA